MTVRNGLRAHAGATGSVRRATRAAWAAVAVGVAAFLVGVPNGSAAVQLGLVQSPSAPVAFSLARGLPAGTGPLVSLDGLLPGETASGILTVRVGTAGPVMLHAAVLPAGSTIIRQLQLRIADVSTGALVYQGSLATVPDTRVCGSGRGACAPWRSGESHALRFTVLLPASTGNAFQGQRGEAVFTWSRDQHGHL